jgi:hypothetical protein
MNIQTICPYCLAIDSISLQKEKDTVVCEACARPFELYPDGRIEKSALYDAAGRVGYYPDRRGLGQGPAGMVTKDNDKRGGK